MNAYLLSFFQLNQHQLVTTFLKVEGTLDGQVDCLAQVHQVRICLVLNLHLLLQRLPAFLVL